jgi:hypothetical protein
MDCPYVAILSRRCSSHSVSNALYDPVDAPTIDPDSGNRDAGRIEVDPVRIVTLNDYAPNEGPVDFYRNENNFYARRKIGNSPRSVL